MRRNDSTVDPDPDEQFHEPKLPTRRQVLKAAGLTMTASPLSHVPQEEKQNIKTIENLLVDDTSVPSAFEPYEMDDPVPLMRTLMAADSRFTPQDFATAGYTEGPDPANPRYTVSTLAMTVSEADALETVGDHTTSEFKDLIGGYNANPWTEWTLTVTSTQNPKRLRLEGQFKVGSTGLENVTWLNASEAAEFGEYWALDATDDHAVLTVVFGHQDGPWRPRSLFKSVTKEMQNQLYS